MIQIQKAKVDGALALSALDKLLKSNELNFAFLAVIPTLLISYSIYNYITSLAGSAQKASLKKVVVLVTLTVRDIERLVLNGGSERSDETVGYILCHLVHLDQIIKSAPFSALQKRALIEDVSDLEASILDDSPPSLVLAIISRIRQIVLI